MEPLTTFAIVSALAGGGASIFNALSQRRENRITRQREDNAISRRIADLEANGLSATLAAGNAASSSSGTAPQVDGDKFDFMARALSLMQGKADVSKTNADTALAQMQATSEQFKQAFMQAQTQGEDLRNSWINADMMSQLNLRGKESQRKAEEIKQIIENTALLKAKTSYEQANTDFIRTQNDNEMIRGDILMNDRAWNDYVNASRVWSNYTSAKFNPASIAGGIIGLSSTLEKQFPNLSFDNSRKQWYFPNR